VLTKRLYKAVSNYIVSANVLKAKIAFFNTILNIVVAYSTTKPVTLPNQSADLTSKNNVS
jgi:hypothetical protein